MNELKRMAQDLRIAPEHETDRLSRALAQTLERGGWQIVSLEIDSVRQTARAEIRRSDGLYVTFDSTPTSTTLTREKQETARGGKVGSGRWRPDILEMGFMGRTKFPGWRSGLRGLANYLADNASTPMLREDVRKAMAPLLSAGASIQ